MFDPFLGLGQPPFPFRGQPFVAPRRPGNFKIFIRPDNLNPGCGPAYAGHLHGSRVAAGKTIGLAARIVKDPGSRQAYYQKQ